MYNSPEFDIFIQLALNIGLLLLVSCFLSVIPLTRNMLLHGIETKRGQLILTVIFSCLCITSTYTAFSVEGVLVNTRVISILVSGTMGTPAIAFWTSIIGGIHRYFYGGFSATACALSTVNTGFLVAYFFPKLFHQRWTTVRIILVTIVSEVVHMLLILTLCDPFEEALQLVRVIALPTIFLNACGVQLMLYALRRILSSEDHDSARQVQHMFSIVEKSLPVLSKGLQNNAALHSITDSLSQENFCIGAVLTDRHEILSVSLNSGFTGLSAQDVLPEVCLQTMQQKCSFETEMILFKSPMHSENAVTVFSEPLIVSGNAVGSLLLLVRRNREYRSFLRSYAENLAVLFSSQLELKELEIQKNLRKQAELNALQAQINPHFLHNALNTISFITREDPDRARALILSLSHYFRATLEQERFLISISEELAQVQIYLELEKARFEDQLVVSINIPKDLDATLPPFTLQPLIENAIKHGARADGKRVVLVNARETNGFVHISVSDEGSGFPPQVIESLQENRSGERYGLINVQRRLVNIYGEAAGLVITSSSHGSSVSFTIPTAQNVPNL